jgi:hypothetical protein
MAKKRPAKKTGKKAKPATRTVKGKKAKSTMAKGKIHFRNKRRSSGRVYVASVTSGSEASSLDPKGRLIDESEVEAVPHVHKGDLSGDLQGLSTAELFDSESVTELSEEGQDLEAELIEGIEDAPDPDQQEVQVHKAPQKDVPEYKDRNRI